MNTGLLQQHFARRPFSGRGEGIGGAACGPFLPSLKGTSAVAARAAAIRRHVARGRVWPRPNARRHGSGSDHRGPRGRSARPHAVASEHWSETAPGALARPDLPPHRPRQPKEGVGGATRLIHRRKPHGRRRRRLKGKGCVPGRVHLARRREHGAQQTGHHRARRKPRPQNHGNRNPGRLAVLPAQHTARVDRPQQHMHQQSGVRLVRRDKVDAAAQRDPERVQAAGHRHRTDGINKPGAAVRACSVKGGAYTA